MGDRGNLCVQLYWVLQTQVWSYMLLSTHAAFMVLDAMVPKVITDVGACASKGTTLRYCKVVLRVQRHTHQLFSLPCSCTLITFLRVITRPPTRIQHTAVQAGRCAPYQLLWVWLTIHRVPPWQLKPRQYPASRAVYPSLRHAERNHPMHSNSLSMKRIQSDRARSASFTSKITLRSNMQKSTKIHVHI